MCGEIDEQILISEELLERFRVMSKMLGADLDGPKVNGPVDLDTAKGRATYMEQLFSLGLQRAVTDASAAEEGRR